MTNSVAAFKYRHNESSIGMFDRSARFFCRNGSWFFRTREEVDCGPYKTHDECKDAYSEFIFLVSDSLSLNANGNKIDEAYSKWLPPDIEFN